MKKINLLLAIGMLSMVFLNSCKKDEMEDPIIPNEEEVITTLNFTLVPDGGGTPVVFSFQDLDGDGGNLPTITGGILDTNASYTCSLELLNELESPAGNITEEVEAEALDHQFFFQTTASGIDIAYDDVDSNGNPIGLSTILTTTIASSGEITVILRHEPNKNASGVSAGNILNAGGETDIEVVFNVDVQ
ncbi:MAG: hypothetical protein ACI85Q_002904 [Salibacteraceae bacterium]|jgi:hypothetical protein